MQTSQRSRLSFVTGLYLAGQTFWSNAQLRCRSLDDPNKGLPAHVQAVDKWQEITNVVMQERLPALKR